MTTLRDAESKMAQRRATTSEPSGARQTGLTVPVLALSGIHSQAALLALQRSAGNRAVISVVQRSRREALQPKVNVVFPTMTVVHNWWIQPGTRGLVEAVPNNGDVTISLRSGEYAGERVQVSPAYVDVDPGGALAQYSHLGKTSLIAALDGAIANPPTPTLKLLQDVIGSATPEQRQAAAADDAFLARAKRGLNDDTYLHLLPALGVHRKPDRMMPGGPGARGHLTGSEADNAIRAELHKEIANAVKAGRSVVGEVSVVGDADFQDAFNRQWIVAAKQTQYATQKAWEICDAFVDVNLPKRHIWVHRSLGDLGTVVHEGMHKYADSRLRDEQIGMCNDKGIAHGGTSKLDEGITEFFTKPVVINQLGVGRADYYANEHKVAKKLADLHGRDTIVRAYFDGAFDALKTAFGDSEWPEFAEKLERGDWSWLQLNGYM